MMTLRTFLDSNILIYADDQAEPFKQEQAREIIKAAVSERKGVISAQVLSEYYWITTRKLKTNAEAAQSRIRMLKTLDLIVVEHEDVCAAIDLVRLRSISYWDALIVRTAVKGGCRELLTEDLNHGERVDSLLIVNPFL